MATPTLLQSLPVRGYQGDNALEIDAGEEVAGGGIDIVRSYSIPDSGLVTTNEIYTCYGINSCGMTFTVAAGRSVNMDMVPVNPITLAEFSDAIVGQFAISVRAGLTSAIKYVVFGTNTDEGQVFLAGQAFKLRWSDNIGGGGAFNISYLLWGFSTLSRGFSFE